MFSDFVTLKKTTKLPFVYKIEKIAVMKYSKLQYNTFAMASSLIVIYSCIYVITGFIEYRTKFENKMPCWYFEKKELKNTPSFQDGIDSETENRYRREGARFIMDAGTKMGLYPLSLIICTGTEKNCNDNLQ